MKMSPSQKIRDIHRKYQKSLENKDIFGQMDNWLEFSAFYTGGFSKQVAQ